MNAYDNDIETMLREAPAPDMGIDPSAVIAGAQRSVRRRRATVGAFGLAAALVIGATVGTTQLANQSSTVPAAQYGTSGPLGAVFKGLKVGGDDGNGSVQMPFAGATGLSPIGGQKYVVTRQDGGLQLRRNSAQSAPLPVVQRLASGIDVFRDGEYTVAAAALPRGTDDAKVLFAPDTGLMVASAVRVSATTNVLLAATNNQVKVRAVTWSIGASYYSTSGERAQVATFGGTHIFWYSGLNIFGLNSLRADSTPDSPLQTGIPDGNKFSLEFATGLPRGSHDVTVHAAAGVRLTTPQVRPLGTSSYDIVYMKAATAKMPPPNLVASITWTDSTGRHTKSFS